MSRSFRIIPSHPDDLGSARVRMPAEEMKKLGISSGNAVRVTGTRTTAATCVPLDGMILQYDSTFKFLSDTQKRLPSVRLSYMVLKNAGGEDALTVVDIERAEEIMIAESVTLSARGRSTYRKEDLVIQNLRGVPFTKGDLLRILNSRSGSGYPFIEFAVIESSPPAKVYTISDRTRIDFAPNNSELHDVLQFSKLKKAIQIGKKVVENKIEITLESVELYDKGWKILCDISYDFDSREWVKNTVYASISAQDDLGTKYRYAMIERGERSWAQGGTHHSKVYVTFVPAVNKYASRIALEIQEISWRRRQKKDLQILEQINETITEEPTVVSVWQQHKYHYMVSCGPWKFEIPLI